MKKEKGAHIPFRTLSKEIHSLSRALLVLGSMERKLKVNVFKRKCDLGLDSP